MHSTRRCSVDGCSRSLKALGLCGGHYQQHLAGKPLRPLRSRPIRERIEDKIVRSPTGCWTWTGHTNGRGYGRIGVDGREQYVHRVAYELFVGPIPEGLEIDHLCKNTRCVNPAHLEPVTHDENVRRSEWFIVTNAAKTECVNGHPYREETTYLSPQGHRACLVCRRIADRRRAAK